MSPWKVILATMVIFGCGVVTGGLLMKAGLPVVPPPVAEVAPHPATTTNNAAQPPPLNQFQQPQFLRRMEKQLDLTPQQRSDIEKIMKDSQERTRPLWNLIAPGLRDEVKRVRQEIRQALDPKQQREFDELLRKNPHRLDTNSPNMRPFRNAPASQSQTNQP